MAELRLISTSRLQMAARMSGDPEGIPVVLVHGNVSSSRFFQELMAMLPPLWKVIAPDLRGFGDSQGLPVDASRGVADYSDDLRGLLQALGLTDEPIHLLGWSLGGGVAMQYAIDHPAHIASLTLIAPSLPMALAAQKMWTARPVSRTLPVRAGAQPTRNLSSGFPFATRARTATSRPAK